MNKLAKAYENFITAIKEETGFNPHITICIHTHSYGNETGNSKDAAINTSYSVSGKLGLNTPIEDGGENSKWVKTRNDSGHTEFIYFYEV